MHRDVHLCRREVTEEYVAAVISKILRLSLSASLAVVWFTPAHSISMHARMLLASGASVKRIIHYHTPEAHTVEATLGIAANIEDILVCFYGNAGWNFPTSGRKSALSTPSAVLTFPKNVSKYFPVINTMR